jgi:uncharacterized protein (TIGR02145 family)
MNIAKTVLFIFAGLTTSVVSFGCSQGSRDNTFDPNGIAYSASSSSNTTSSGQSSSSELGSSSSSSSGESISGFCATPNNCGSFEDTRGDTTSYKWIKIGTQTWMAQNLNYGSQVLDSLGDASQSNDSKAEKFCYDDESSKCDTEGGLYQWAEAMALPSICDTTLCADSIKSPIHQGICPKNWHIPSAAEWDTLGTFLSTADSAGAMLKLNGTGFENWDASTYNKGNPYEFSAQPTGLRFDGGGFYSRGSLAIFWEAAEIDAFNANDRNLDTNHTNLFKIPDIKLSGFSVRCIQD